jgi:DNA-directed RNA polymerase specialized sigma24 family protein
LPPPGVPVTPEAVRAFLARSSTTRAVRAVILTLVPSAEVEALVKESMLEATAAADRTAPSTHDALPMWVVAIAHRVVADFLERSTRRARYQGSLPPRARDYDESGEDVAQAAGYDPDEDSKIERNDHVRRWIERAVARSPRDRETLDILLEHARHGKPYKKIAAERGLTMPSLTARTFEFRKRFAQRYAHRHDRMKLWIALGAATAIAAIAAEWLLRPAAVHAMEPHRSVLLQRTASASPPPFDPELSLLSETPRRS